MDDSVLCTSDLTATLFRFVLKYSRAAETGGNPAVAFSAFQRWTLCIPSKPVSTGADWTSQDVKEIWIDDEPEPVSEQMNESQMRKVRSWVEWMNSHAGVWEYIKKKKILCCLLRLRTLCHNVKRHSSPPCAWRTSAETFLLLVPQGTTSFHANSALYSDSGRLWCCSILLRASSYAAKFQASSRLLQGKPSYCTHSPRSLKVLNRFPKQWASYCSRLECTSDSDSECVPLNKTLWAPQQPPLEKCFTRFTLIKIHWECWRPWVVTLVSQTKSCRLSLTPSQQNVPKEAAAKLK